MYEKKEHFFSGERSIEKFQVSIDINGCEIRLAVRTKNLAISREDFFDNGQFPL